MTWADLAFLAMTDWLTMTGCVSQIDNYPKLKAVLEKVSKAPKVAEWLEKRPKTSF